MLWKTGKVLTKPEDFTETMLELEDLDEATEFRELLFHSHPELATDILRYALRDCPYPDKPRIVQLMQMDPDEFMEISPKEVMSPALRALFNTFDD
jgi:hypothetical protein